jgi:hypothetical protein
MANYVIRIEGDILFLKWTGELSPSDVRATLQVMEGILAEHKWVFMVIDAQDATSWGREARKIVIEWPYQGRIGAVAHFGASLTIRALAGIVIGALKVLRLKSPPPSYFGADEKEALACVEKRRRELMASAETPKH